MKEIGHRRRPVDWDTRTSGRITYSADLRFDGLLEAAILRSPYPHARICAIDTSRARAMPGVHAIITAADFHAGARYLHEGASDRPPLADGPVRFIGQEVAAVAAETRAQALAALRLIEIEYQILLAPLNIEAALASGAARLHDRPTGKTNLSHFIQRDWGSAEAGRRASNLIVAGEFFFPRQAHVCMEPHIAIAKWDEARQQLHYWTSTQAPYYVVKEAAHVLGLRTDQVICHEVGVGGGFGAKSKICEFETIAGLLARYARRPVRIQLSREEDFEVTKTRHAFHTSMRLHADAAGRLRAIDATVKVENGAYDHCGRSVMNSGLKALGSIYRPDGVTSRGWLVDTALNPGGAFRGYGSTQTGFALECLMDELAERLDTDPFDLRLKNANQAGEVLLQGGRISSARLIECLDAVRVAIGWNKEKANRKPGRGIGMAACNHGSGTYNDIAANRSDAAVDIFPDGHIRLRFGGADTGTGQKTCMVQIVAEELGVDCEAVEVLTMDSERTPFDMGSWSSRGAHFGGHAARTAAKATADRLKSLAASKLDGELWLKDGAVRNSNDAIRLGDLVRLSNETVEGCLTTETSFVETTIEMANRETGQGQVTPTYNFGAHAGIVEVDTRTGRIKIIDYVAAHDIGTALNPLLVEGQIAGGVAMGLGSALSEEVIFEQGKMVNPSYMHYALPRAADLSRIRPILIEGGDPIGPYGAKGVAECATIPPPAVISNAIYDAIGIRLRELPFTPDKILTALAKRDSRRRRYALWRRPSRWWIALVRWAYPHGLLKLLHARTSPPESRADPASLEKIETPYALSELFNALGPDAMLMGGGTDVQPMRRQRLVEPRRLVALRRVKELQGIRTLTDGGIEIGAAVTLAALRAEVGSGTPAIAAAIDTIASAQIREMATIGGNLLQAKRCWFFRNGFGCYKRRGGLAPCYAVDGDHRFYHAAINGHRCQATTPSDLATVFTAFDAEALVTSASGDRVISMDAFYSGPGEATLGVGEVVRTIRISGNAMMRVGAFAKLRLWEGDFAIVSAAVTVLIGPDGIWHAPRIVIGGLAPTPWRARETERQVSGRQPNLAVLRQALDRELTAHAHPLAHNGWKLDAALGIVEEATEQLLARSREESQRASGLNRIPAR